MHPFEISCKDYIRLRAHGTTHILVDVRTIPEWIGPHIEGAIHIPLSKIQDRAPEALPDKNAQIILYCAHGERSLIATEILRAAGYTNVFSLAGGYSAFIHEV